jgi:hypothetical protein
VVLGRTRGGEGWYLRSPPPSRTSQRRRTRRLDTAPSGAESTGRPVIHRSRCGRSSGCARRGPVAADKDLAGRELEQRVVDGACRVGIADRGKLDVEARGAGQPQECLELARGAGSARVRVADPVEPVQPRRHDEREGRAALARAAPTGGDHGARVGSPVRQHEHAGAGRYGSCDDVHRTLRSIAGGVTRFACAGRALLRA